MKAKPKPKPADTGPSFTDIVEDSEAAEAAERREREETFSGGDHATWHGRELRPFTISRETLFFCLRVHGGHPPLSMVVKRLEAFAADAMIILWLCDHDPEHWSPMRSDPAAMLADIDRWADEHVQPDEIGAARLLGLRILNRSRLNRAEPAPVPAPRGASAAYDPGNSPSR